MFGLIDLDNPATPSSVETQSSIASEVEFVTMQPCTSLSSTMRDSIVRPCVLQFSDIIEETEIEEQEIAQTDLQTLAPKSILKTKSSKIVEKRVKNTPIITPTDPLLSSTEGLQVKEAKKRGRPAMTDEQKKEAKRLRNEDKQNK